MRKRFRVFAVVWFLQSPTPDLYFLGMKGDIQPNFSYERLLVKMERLSDLLETFLNQLDQFEIFLITIVLSLLLCGL